MLSLFNLGWQQWLFTPVGHRLNVSIPKALTPRSSEADRSFSEGDWRLENEFRMKEYFMTLEDWEPSLYHLLKAQKKLVLSLETERGSLTGNIISVELGHEDFPSLISVQDEKTGERVLSFRQIISILAHDKILWDAESVKS